MPKKNRGSKAGSSENRNKTLKVPISARLLGSEDRDEVPQAVAYAFDRGGQLLDRATLSEAGEATLSVPVGEEGRSVRLVVGGEVEEEPRVGALLHRRGLERQLRLRPGDELEGLEFVVPEESWLCWFRGLCLVRGTLLRRHERDGITMETPVCNAEVEIFEVDPFYVLLPKIPDFELERVRDAIIDPRLLGTQLERPRRIPRPGPIPPIGEMELSPTTLAADVPVPRAADFAEGSPQPEPPTLPGPSPAPLPEMPADLVFAAQAGGLDVLRTTLQKYPDLGRFLLCTIFPRLVTMQSMGTARTDDCGRFSKLLQSGCENIDTPDLYFRATQRLFGLFEFQVYGPTPVACHTWWNYQCGTEVTLYTDHPLAQTCAPCPGVNAPNRWVLAMAIGNTRLDRVYGVGPDLQSATTPANRGMLAPSSSGGHDRPFGGLCRLRLEFDSTDLRSRGIKYYRVSWRKGTSGRWAPLTGSVVRHYHKEVGDDLVLQVYPLGPQSVPVSGTSDEESNLYEIPPALPPEGGWSFPDVVEDTTSAKFPTHTLPPVGDPALDTEQELLAQAGKYQLKVDLFDEDGHQVDISAENVKYRVPDGEDGAGNVDTEDAALLGLVDGNSLVLPIHVDNNRCTAEIHPPSIAGTPALGSCGVLLYDPKVYPGGQTVTMPFTAQHPNGHATYTFRLKRGLDPIDSTGGKVPGGVMTKDIDSALLGPCVTHTGGVAAFAEHLHVDALATNGWSTLHSYDAGDVGAFVLTPERPGGGGGGGAGGGGGGGS